MKLTLLEGTAEKQQYISTSSLWSGKKKYVVGRREGRLLKKKMRCEGGSCRTKLLNLTMLQRPHANLHLPTDAMQKA